MNRSIFLYLMFTSVCCGYFIQLPETIKPGVTLHHNTIRAVASPRSCGFFTLSIPYPVDSNYIVYSYKYVAQEQTLVPLGKSSLGELLNRPIYFDDAGRMGDYYYIIVHPLASDYIPHQIPFLIKSTFDSTLKPPPSAYKPLNLRFTDIFNTQEKKYLLTKMASILLSGFSFFTVGIYIRNKHVTQYIPIVSPIYTDAFRSDNYKKSHTESEKLWNNIANKLDEKILIVPRDQESIRKLLESLWKERYPKSPTEKTNLWEAWIKECLAVQLEGLYNPHTILVPSTLTTQEIPKYQIDEINRRIDHTVRTIKAEIALLERDRNI